MAASRLMSRNLFFSLSQPKCYKYLSFTGTSRCYSNLPLTYEADKDPAPYFFSTSVQKLLYYLTRPTFSKVFRKRTNQGDKSLSTPVYKFMTDEELQEEIKKAKEKAKYLLHMPPVVSSQPLDAEKIIDKDPYILGHDNSKYIFTDITFGLKYSERMVVIRDTDGTLKHSNLAIKKRLIETYFPLTGRKLKEPLMFTEVSHMNRLLESKKYEFILDRACIQYEPEEESYQRITSRVYQHCDMNVAYELLRSTRHFGPMTFYFAWHNVIDGLMLELLQNGYIKEATALVNLYRTLHSETIEKDESKALVDEILKGKELPDEEIITSAYTNADIEIEYQCMNCIEGYINKESTRKAQQELALQAYRELFNQKIKVEEGIRYAHGTT